VTFGALFLLKFVVLAQLSAPGGGRLNRILQTLLEGMTLGTLLQPSQHAVTGYLALATIVLFLVALVLLPMRSVQTTGGALVKNARESRE
jgi:predicted lysophospholipase L1 biosynthesis ABC-type transport system permease subunit